MIALGFANCLKGLTAKITAITPSGSHSLATSAIEGEVRVIVKRQRPGARPPGPPMRGPSGRETSERRFTAGSGSSSCTPAKYSVI